MIRKIGDTIVVDFCTHNPSTGAVSDADSSPTCEVFENDTDTGLSGVTVAKRSGKTGNYRVSIVCSEANGYEVGKSYNAIVSATVNSVSGKAVVCSFTLDSVRMSEIPDAIQDETQSDHTSTGTFGKFLDSQVSDISGGSGATPAEIADAVWDETRGDHTNIGTFGKFLDSQVSDISGGSGATAEEVADAVWNELASDHSTTGTFGRFLDGKVSLIPTNPLLTNDDRLDALDTSISSRASQGSVDLIPTNPLLTNDLRIDALDTSISSRLSSSDLRLDSLDTSISSRASQGSVNLIPTNPLLTDDTRLDALDTSISSRLASVDLRLNSLDTSISSRASQDSVNSIPTNPLLRDDTRLDYLDSSISSRASQASVDLIPTNPLLTDDTRLDYLDASISSVGGASAEQIADAVWDETRGDHTNLGTFGKFLDIEVSSLETGVITTDQIADAVQNELASDHSTVGTFGRFLDNKISDIPTNPLLDDDLRLNYLDTSISSRASQGSVDLIPTNPLLTDDTRLDYIDTSISSRASQSSVNLIPTNPLLTDDNRLDYLDASISSRASQGSVDLIPTNPLLVDDTRLNYLDASISSIDPPTTSEIVNAIQDETRGDHTNTGTFGKFLDAEVSSLVTGGITADQIADAVQDETRFGHTNIGTFGSFVDTSISSRSSQSSVDLIPTNPLLTDDDRLDAIDTSISSRLASNDLRLNSLDTSISSRASQGSVNLIPTNPLLTNDLRLNAIDTSISSRLSSSDLRLNSLDDSISSRASQASIDLIPTNTLLTDDTRLNYLDASISQIESPPSVVEIADAVQDETRGDHTGVDTFGKYLDAQVSDISGGSGATPSEIADAIWDETRGDHTNIGTFGSFIDTPISSRASQASVNAIPTNPLLTTDLRLNAIDTSISSRLASSDIRLNSLDTSISSRASQISVNAIPTNPLLTNDSRLNYLDASISQIPDAPSAIEIADAVQDETRSEHTGIGTFGSILDTTLSSLDLTVDFTSIDEKLDLILKDTSELQAWQDVSGVLYEMLSSVALEYAGVGDRLIDFTVIVQDSTETISNVRISILSGNTPVAFGLSSLSGEFSALLFDGTYQITCAKVGYSFTTPMEIVVTQNGSIIIEASEIVVAAPFPAETCRIWEYCYDPEGAPLPSISAIARIVALPYDYGGKLISGEDVIGTYDPNTGLVYWDIVHGARVSFNIREVMVSVIRTVPEIGSQRLSELPGGC